MRLSFFSLMTLRGFAPCKGFYIAPCKGCKEKKADKKNTAQK